MKKINDLAYLSLVSSFGGAVNLNTKSCNLANTFGMEWVGSFYKNNNGIWISRWLRDYPIKFQPQLHIILRIISSYGLVRSYFWLCKSVETCLIPHLDSTSPKSSLRNPSKASGGLYLDFFLPKQTKKQRNKEKLFLCNNINN